MTLFFRLALPLALLGVTVPAGASDHPDERWVEVAGPDGDLRRLAHVTYEVVVDVDPEAAWAVLADFGSVHAYVASIVASDWIGEPTLQPGAARSCDLDFQGREVHVKERIFALGDRSFVYDVYDWTNFPLKHMHNTFGVRVDDQGKTVLYNVIDYQLKPSFLTGVMRGKLRGSARSTLLAFKHYLETGDGGLSGDALDARYPGV